MKMIKNNIFFGSVLVLLAIGLLLLSAYQTESSPIAESDLITNPTPRITQSNSGKYKRLWGTDRYETAKVIAEDYFGPEMENVILVPGCDFSNALPATVLAYKYNAPMLLIDKTSESYAQAINYVESHLSKTGTIYIVGDYELINDQLESKLVQLGYTNLVKIYGVDKYETDYLIAKKINAQIGTKVVIATGEDYPDALSISSFAAANGWPIIFSKSDSITDESKEYLKSIVPSAIYISGGTEAVSPIVEEEIAKILPSTKIKRFAGEDRYNTSILIAKELAPHPENVYIASGDSFPDAILGGLAAAKTKDPVVLIDPLMKKSLPEEVNNYLKNSQVNTGLNIICLGGYEIIPIQVENILKQVLRIVDPYVKYSYEQMIQDADKLAKNYPEIIKLDSIGKSVEDRDLLLIKLGNGDKKVFLNGSFHAREYITTTFLMKMIDEYSYAYSNDEKFNNFDVKSLLNHVTLYIVPMVNPDGVNLVQNGVDAAYNPDKIKKMRQMHPKLGFASWKANIKGVDLNRNFPVGWEVKSSDTNVPSSENYKGMEAMTEPEVNAVMNLVKNNTFQIIASYHTQGEDIFWSDKNCRSFNHLLEPMADRLVQLTGYRKGPKVHAAGDWGSGIADWTRSLKIPTFTIELCPHISETPYPDSRFDDVWNKVKSTGLFFAQEAVNL